MIVEDDHRSHTLNQFETPIEAVLPDVVSLLKQVDLASGIWYTATDLLSWDIFFPHTYQKGGSETVGIHLEWTTRHIYSLAPGHGKSPVLCVNRVQRNLGHLDIQNITLIYSNDDNMLIRPND